MHLPRLPEAFRGMKIAQVSDLHYTEYTEGFFLRDVVRHVNRLKPDMVVITGDFITYGPMPYSYARHRMPECAEILSGIACPLVYASLGNHDCTIGASYVIGPLEDHKIPTLFNQALPLERSGQRLWLVGTGSACTGDCDPQRAFPAAVARGGEPAILLAHEPDLLREFSLFGPELILSGHTHGGQVRLPFLPAINLPEYGRQYVEGWFHYGPTQLYVNRGIGAVGLPFRLNCPPEITLFTLA